MKIKMWMVAIFLVAACALSGCQTAEGVTKSVAYGIGETATGVATDAYNAVGVIPTIDNWIKKNLW